MAVTVVHNATIILGCVGPAAVMFGRQWDGWVRICNPQKLRTHFARYNTCLLLAKMIRVVALATV